MDNNLMKNIIFICCTLISYFSLSVNAMAGDSFYKNDKWGLKFIIPDGVNIYTADKPGSMASRINSRTPLWLVSSSLATERINLKVSDYQDATESELNETKQELDKGTPYRSIKQYQKISVMSIKIGKESNKNAVEHIHALKQREPKQIRQIMFVHRGRVFSFTCATSPERFASADKSFFTLIFDSMEFY